MQETPDAAEPADDAAECVTFPVESPLTGNYDALTGVLTLESTRKAAERPAKKHVSGLEAVWAARPAHEVR